MVKAEGQSGDRAEALRLLLRTSRPHRRALLVGGVATLGVIAMRLALPWPLRGVIENVFPPAAGETGPLAAPPGLDPVLGFCLLYVLFALGVGSFEWIQRVWMARVASRTAHDLRTRAVDAARSTATRSTSDDADLITRVVGDVARIRADLKGILIHLGQNGLLLLGITALFLYLAPKLGALFLLAGLLAVLIGYLTVEEVAETASRHRRKESRYAAAVQERAEETEAISRSSTRKDVRTTRIIGRATWLIHVGVAATIALALWIGVQDVRSGILAPGELFLFIAYAITIQRRAVMIGRQIARGGKLLANTDRLGRLIASSRRPSAEARPLAEALRLEEVRLKRFSGQSGKARLGPLDLELRRRERLLVLGPTGSGKSSLLGLLAGRLPATEGRVIWDDQEVGEHRDLLCSSVAYLPDEPEFGRVEARSLLALGEAEAPSAGQQALLETLGAWSVVGRFREGLDQRVRSAELSPRERRALVLAGILLGEASVWVLDNPVDSKSARDRERLAAILERAADRTLVVALRRPVDTARFTRVIRLRKGRIDFDGSPREWEARRARRRQIRGASQ